jgi:Ca-activated chloride channel family protein
MMRFIALPWALVLVPLLGVGAAWLVLRAARLRAQRMQRMAEPSLLDRIAPARRSPRRRALVLGAAAALAALAFAGPQWGTERTIVRSEGADVVLALDASLSMLAEDVEPNRLTRMKREATQLIARSPGDRFGLIAFAGRSYILTPLTVDRGALALFLDNLDPDVVGQGGSSLARTIRQGVELLMPTKGGGDRALVVMSDGETFDERAEVLAAARRAREANVSLVTVGYGTPEGSTIPVASGRGVELKRDENNQVVVTRHDETLLREAADAAGGTFIPASATDKAARVRQALALLERQQRAMDAGRERQQRFQLFLFPALLLVMIDTWLAERRGRGRPSASSRAAAAAAAMVPLLMLGGCVSLSPDEAERLYQQERYTEAGAAWRRAVTEGDTTVRTYYNLGTALLKAQRPKEAIEPLERAAAAIDPEVRYRALFNLGLLHLEQARAAEGEAADGEFAAANALYRRALRLRPAELDAKWNYELTLRDPPQGGGGGGGGGGGSAEPEQGQAQPEPQPTPQPAGGLDPRQAERLLNSAAREERDVQGRKQKQTRAERPPLGMVW